jgi:hypothetical protein
MGELKTARQAYICAVHRKAPAHPARQIFIFLFFVKGLTTTACAALHATIAPGLLSQGTADRLNLAIFSTFPEKTC